MLVRSGTLRLAIDSRTKGSALRISIDTTEPLEDVIRVVGALYDVTLAVAATSETAEAVPARVPAGRGVSRTAKGKASRAKSNGRGRAGSGDQSDKRLGTVSNDDLRSWARENGHTVSDRGRVPAAVVTAYHERQGA
jgi:hypothetical protein